MKNEKQKGYNTHKYKFLRFEGIEEITMKNVK